MNAHDLHHFFSDEMPMCGCGNPESVGFMVRDILALCPLYESASQAKIKLILPNDGVFYLVLGVLDRVGLIEHGGGIGGSWITPKGEMILNSLRVEMEKEEGIEAIFGCEWHNFIPDDCDKCHPKMEAQ